MATPREQMAEKIRQTMSTEQIIEAVMLLAHTDDIDKVVVRVALLNAYEQREGSEAVDALMDAVGL
jgi:hypothetical protein